VFWIDLGLALGLAVFGLDWMMLQFLGMSVVLDRSAKETKWY
jgi:hypothetical protein